MRSVSACVTSLSSQLPKCLVAATGLAVGLVAPNVAHGTVLTFDGTVFTPNSFIPDGYGDRVVSTGNATDPYQYSLDCGPTPDILVEYVSQGGSQSRWKPAGYGNLQNFMWVDYPNSQSQRFLEVSMSNIPQIAPPPGSPTGLVYLYGFDLACELSEGPGLPVISIEVVRTGGPLPNGVIYSAADVFVPGDNLNPTRRSIVFDPPLVGQTLSIRINMTNLLDKSNRIAIDNIKFGQNYIPSPGPATLALAGIALMAHRRRRGPSASRS